MFNIGLGEILVIAVLGLLIFGPDRLPEAAGKAGRALRQLKALASNATEDFKQAAGLDGQDSSALADLRDLHPKRIAASVLEPDPKPRAKGSSQASANGSKNVGPDNTAATEGAEHERPQGAGGLPPGIDPDLA